MVRPLTVATVMTASAQHNYHQPKFKQQADPQTCAGSNMNMGNYTAPNGMKCNNFPNQQACFGIAMQAGWSTPQIASLLFHCRESCELCPAKLCDDKDALIKQLAGNNAMDCNMVYNMVVNSGHSCDTHLGTAIPALSFLHNLPGRITLGDVCATKCYDSKCPECQSHGQCANWQYCDYSGFCFADYQCCEYNDAIDGNCPMNCNADFDEETYLEQQPVKECTDDNNCSHGEFCGGAGDDPDGRRICKTCNKCQNAFKSPLGYDEKCHQRCRQWCDEQVMKDTEAYKGRMCFQGNEEYGRCATCGYTDDASTLSSDPSQCITCEDGFAIDLKDSGLNSDCTGYCVPTDKLSTWGIGMYPCKPRAKCIADGFRVDRQVLIALVLGVTGAVICSCCLTLCCCVICCCICCKCCCGKTEQKKPAQQHQPVVMMQQMQPPVQARQQMGSPQCVTNLPPGWTVARDPATGRNYYCNAATQQTSWTHPVTGI